MAEGRFWYCHSVHKFTKSCMLSDQDGCESDEEEVENREEEEDNDDRDDVADGVAEEEGEGSDVGVDSVS